MAVRIRRPAGSGLRASIGIRLSRTKGINDYTPVPGMPPLKKPRAAPEDVLQVAIWKALRLLLPPEVVCWSTESRKAGVREGARRKARGVIAGVPDMTFHWPGGMTYVELKVPGRVPSDEQLRLHRRLREIGVLVAVATSLTELLVALRAAGCPLRCNWP